MRIADEGEEVEAATMRGEHTHDLLHRETEAPIDTVKPVLAANSIHMYLPRRTEAAAHLDRLPALARLAILVLVPVPAHHRDDVALAGAARHTADRDRGPDHPLIEAAEERGDAAHTTVIATDPNSAVNHTAHVLPDEAEAEADRVPSPAA